MHKVYYYTVTFKDISVPVRSMFMVMQSQSAFTLCVKPYFNMGNQQAMCRAQTVGGRYLSNLCIIRSCLPGTSEMCIHANRLNEKKAFCSLTSVS